MQNGVCVCVCTSEQCASLFSYCSYGETLACRAGKREGRVGEGEDGDIRYEDATTTSTITTAKLKKRGTETHAKESVEGIEGREVWGRRRRALRGNEVICNMMAMMSQRKTAHTHTHTHTYIHIRTPHEDP